MEYISSQVQGGGKYCNVVDLPILPFLARVMIGGLPLGSTFNRRGLGLGTCFFFTIPLEGSTQIFIKCPKDVLIIDLASVI